MPPSKAKPASVESPPNVGHLKAIGYTPQAQPLLDKAGVEPGANAVRPETVVNAFITPAGTRPWAREPSVRILA